MQIANFPPPVRTRATAFAVTVAVHIALFAWWRLTAAPAAPESYQDLAPAIQWIQAFVRPPAIKAPAPKKTQRAPASGTPAMAPQPGTERPLAAAPVPAEPLAADPSFAEQPVPSLRERALRDAGAADKAVRKESPANHISSSFSSPQSRLAAGIESAARPKLWEAPIITPVADQGQNGRRIYKVTTARGSYCVYYDANHTPNGIDMMQKGIQPKTASCPRES